MVENPKPIYYLTANARSMRLKLHLVNKLHDDDITKCMWKCSNRISARRYISILIIEVNHFANIEGQSSMDKSIDILFNVEKDFFYCVLFSTLFWHFNSIFMSFSSKFCSQIGLIGWTKKYKNWSANYPFN